MMRTLCGILLSFFVISVCAQEQLEIIPLQHRLAEQVLPVLRPLLAPGGSLSAMSGKLVVRSTPANIAQIREVLAAIDTPQRRLLISVRQGSVGQQDMAAGGISSGRVIVGPNGVTTQLQGGVVARDSQRSNNLVQQVQTVEGGEASIFIGRSLSLPMRQLLRSGNGVVLADTQQMVDVSSGFRARPELAGERVQLTISPQMQRVIAGGVAGSALSTTLSGRLGEWIYLGGSTTATQSGERGLASYGAARDSDAAEVWLKVELLD